MLSEKIFMTLFLVIWPLWICLGLGFWLIYPTKVVKKIFFIGFSVLSLLIIASAFVASKASAAENSAPAGLPAVAEKSTACPTEFNPDDLGWAMNRIRRSDKKTDNGPVVIENIRIFSYIPELEKRIFIGMKKLWNPDCVAALYSYGSVGDSDGKQVFAIIRSPSRTLIFLLAGKEWKNGDNIETFVSDCNAKGCNLTFTLYRNKELVAARTLPIQQFSHPRFQEPVE